MRCLRVVRGGTLTSLVGKRIGNQPVTPGKPSALRLSDSKVGASRRGRKQRMTTNEEVNVGVVSVNEQISQAAKRPELFDNVLIPVKSVNRITVVGETGIVFERYNLFENGVDLVFQDQGRTLKIFPRGVIDDARTN